MEANHKNKEILLAEIGSKFHDWALFFLKKNKNILFQKSHALDSLGEYVGFLYTPSVFKGKLRLFCQLYNLNYEDRITATLPVHDANGNLIKDASGNKMYITKEFIKISDKTKDDA